MARLVTVTNESDIRARIDDFKVRHKWTASYEATGYKEGEGKYKKWLSPFEDTETMLKRVFKKSKIEGYALYNNADEMSAIIVGCKNPDYDSPFYDVDVAVIKDEKNTIKLKSRYLIMYLSSRDMTGITISCPQAGKYTGPLSTLYSVVKLPEWPINLIEVQKAD